MILSDRFLRTLGLCVKAGRCQFGSESCAAGVKRGKIRLLIADASLSPRSQKDMRCMCAFYHTPLIFAEPAGAAGRACGKPNIKIIGIADDGLAKKLLDLSKYAEV